IANRKVLIDVPDDWGINDGLKIDSEGCLWVAFYGGSAVRRFSAEGPLMETIKIPAPKVTSVIFGGAELDELYVTSAGGEDGSDTLDGALFRLRPGVKGRVSFRSKMEATL
ncbi:MAG: SMP-30/gluconolactonase/LRE family protein, partial [Abditibacteriaceae bacterium]